MSSRNSVAAIVMAGLLAVGLLGLAPAADAASAKRSVVKPGESARNNVIEFKRRVRGVRIHLPVGPSYIYYDYPYYYSRGYYPTHIGGYVYYPYALYGRRCFVRNQRCVANWAHNRGPRSPRAHREACRCL